MRRRAQAFAPVLASRPPAGFTPDLAGSLNDLVTTVCRYVGERACVVVVCGGGGLVVARPEAAVNCIAGWLMGRFPPQAHTPDSLAGRR